jgi:AcrR family transcriptional regulator
MTRRVGLNRDTVIATAAELADLEGLEQVTVKRVAGVLGVRPPSLYAHIAGLEDLLRGIGAKSNAELARLLTDAVGGLCGFDALRSLSVAYRDFARAHPGGYAAIQRARDLARDEESQAAGDAVVAVALKTLRGYELDGHEAIHAVRIVRIALHGFIGLESADGFAVPLSPDETFDRMLVVIDQGLRAGRP